MQTNGLEETLDQMTDRRPIYLDCNATTPIEPRVRDVILHYLDYEYGNAGSRTHVYGQAAARGIKKAREQIASVVSAAPEEVVLTSGATEANNLAILGLADYGQRTGKRHVISTQIEHKAVLEPLKLLGDQGFEIELVPPTQGGFINPTEIGRRVRSDTLLVSAMHVNNDTGIIQPLDGICDELAQTQTLLHVDAAQGFAKELTQLTNSRIDLISASSHKIHGPVGVGSLIVRRARKAHRALKARQIGGNQERGLRSGTVPTFLVCAFGEACAAALDQHESRVARWKQLEEQLLTAFEGLPINLHGDSSRRLHNSLNFSLADIDAEATILALRETVSIASGSACTSSTTEPSHVITAMYGTGSQYATTACRASWSHLTEDLPTFTINSKLRSLL